MTTSSEEIKESAPPEWIDTQALYNQLRLRLYLRLLELWMQEPPLLTTQDDTVTLGHPEAVVVKDRYAAGLVEALRRLEDTQTDRTIGAFWQQLSEVALASMQAASRRPPEVREKIAAGQR